MGRLGILVDFLSHSTILGFMGGTAVIICLQQLKGIFGLTHFTSKTDVYSVLHAVFSLRKEWKWESALVGVVFLLFLQFTRYLRNRKPKLFWVSAMAPMVTVIVGCLFAYFIKGSQHGILTVGHLSKGINPISIHFLNFDSKYLSAVVQTGLITGLIALAEGIAIGRSFAIIKNEQIDGNKEMIAFGLMNIVGSFTSCYLTTGPFSKTAVNFNAGCRTAMSNIVMAIFMALTLLFLAPVFSYTPLVALSAIIMSAMLGLIKYEEMYHLLKVDKFDFCIYSRPPPSIFFSFVPLPVTYQSPSPSPIFFSSLFALAVGRLKPIARPRSGSHRVTPRRVTPSTVPNCRRYAMVVIAHVVDVYSSHVFRARVEPLLQASCGFYFVQHFSCRFACGCPCFTLHLHL
uniref:SLC26A/SulP transporter domain-containing protein n=1 Tax=Cucumis sativus TaxID=3659 RepID=A0A0A0LWX8_CUCSA